MESLEATAGFMDELLNFSSDLEEGDDEEEKPRKACLHGLGLPSFGLLDPDAHGSSSFTETGEEELEWISNKDAFPSLETFIDMLPSYPAKKQLSPISVLDPTSATAMMSVSVPVKARTKRRRRCLRDIRCLWAPQQQQQVSRREKQRVSVSLGRKCQHCGAEKTPQWRAGPAGPKTLCNACGVRFKSGRLCPEYRPASSPTFSPQVHSNSHRKIVEMRRGRQSSG